MNFLTEITGLITDLTNIVEEYALPSIIEKCYPNMPVDCIVPISPNKIASVGNGKAMINGLTLIDYITDNEHPVVCCKELHNGNVAVCAGNCIYIWDLRNLNYPVDVIRFNEEDIIVEIYISRYDDNIIVSTTQRVILLRDIGYGEFSREYIGDGKFTHMSVWYRTGILYSQNNEIITRDYPGKEQTIKKESKERLVGLFWGSEYHIISVFADGTFVVNKYADHTVVKIWHSDIAIKECIKCDSTVLFCTPGKKVYRTNFPTDDGAVEIKNIRATGLSYANNKIITWNDETFQVLNDETYESDDTEDYYNYEGGQIKSIIGLRGNYLLVVNSNNQVYVSERAGDSDRLLAPFVNSAVLANNTLVVGVGNELITFDTTSYKRLNTIRWFNDEGKIERLRRYNQQYVESYNFDKKMDDSKIIHEWNITAKSWNRSKPISILKVINCATYINRSYACCDGSQTIKIYPHGRADSWYASRPENKGGIAQLDKVRILSENKLTIRSEIKGHTSPVNHVISSSQYLISGSDDGEIRFWLKSSTTCACVLIGEHKAAISHLSIIKGICKTEFLISQDKTGLVCIWNISRHRCITRITKFPFAFEHIGDGKFIEKRCDKNVGVRIFI